MHISELRRMTRENNSLQYIINQAIDLCVSVAKEGRGATKYYCPTESLQAINKTIEDLCLALRKRGFVVEERGPNMIRIAWEEEIQAQRNANVASARERQRPIRNRPRMNIEPIQLIDDGYES